MPDVEEMLYAALEDFRIDILIGAGPERAAPTRCRFRNSRPSARPRGRAW